MNLLHEARSHWWAYSCSATLEIPRLLWNTKIDYHVHKTPPPDPVLSQINPFRTSYLTSASHLRLGLPNCLFPSGFKIILYMIFLFLHLPVHAYVPFALSRLLCYLNTITSTNFLSSLFSNRGAHKPSSTSIQSMQNSRVTTFNWQLSAYLMTTLVQIINNAKFFLSPPVSSSCLFFRLEQPNPLS